MWKEVKKFITDLLYGTFLMLCIIGSGWLSYKAWESISPEEPPSKVEFLDEHPSQSDDVHKLFERFIDAEGESLHFNGDYFTLI